MIRYNNLSEEVIKVHVSEGVPMRAPFADDGFAMALNHKTHWTAVNYQFCRDTLQNGWKDNSTRRILFYSTDSKINTVCNFIGFAEDHFKLKARSVIHKTHLDNLYGVFLAPWWIRYNLRKSFLSGMIRLSNHCSDLEAPKDLENFKSALTTKLTNSRFNYFKSNPKALDLFMNGYTKSINVKAQPGWREMFSGLYTPDSQRNNSYSPVTPLTEETIQKVLHKRLKKVS